MNALATIRKVGIQARPVTDRGAEEYITARTDWECFVRRLAPFMVYAIDEIDRVTPQTRIAG